MDSVVDLCPKLPVQSAPSRMVCKTVVHKRWLSPVFRDFSPVIWIFWLDVTVHVIRSQVGSSPWKVQYVTICSLDRRDDELTVSFPHVVL